MPYMGGRALARVRASQPVLPTDGFMRQPNVGANYQTTLRRHEYSASVTGLSGASLPTGQYGYISLLAFNRSFGGVTNGEPTPTAGNNYQTGNVMNGSEVRDFHADITIKGEPTQGSFYLDVYEVQLSFYDAYIWNGLAPASCPVAFYTAVPAPDDLRGQITIKAPTQTLILDNTIKNSNFVSHYIKKKGSIFIQGGGGAADSDSVTLSIDGPPPKCTRMNVGTFWGLFFVNDSIKNDSLAISCQASVEVSFKEIPSNLKLPYLD